jgi:outer membrane protein OmpA-like peptidoglycan-associated protein
MRKGQETMDTSLSNISNLGEQFTHSGLLDSISHLVGSTPETTKKTLGAAIPATMYSIADHASTDTGAASLIDGLKSGSAPQLDVSELGRTLDDPLASERLMKTSGGFLERMMGGSGLGGLVSKLSSFGGGDRGVVSKLLALAAPIALGLVGRKVREGGLDAHGLAGVMRDEKSKVASLVPGALRDTIGLPSTTNGHVTDMRRETVANTPYVVTREHEEPIVRRSIWGWVLLAVAAIVGLSWLLARVIRGRNPVNEAPTPAETAPPPEHSVTPTPPAETPTVSGPIGQISSFLGSGQTTSQRFALDNINFGTGESTLSSSAQSGVAQLAAVLKGHPDAKVRVEGYAADANRELGQARADSVKNALINDGIASDRIETATSGQENPSPVEVVVSPR